MQRQAKKAGIFKIFFALMLWAGMGLSGTAALCADAPSADAPEPPNPPDTWQINADRIDYDQNQDEYVAVGNVSIVKQGRTLTADSVHLKQRSGQAFADGHVRLISNSDVLSGSRLELNLNDETGILTDGTVFISQNHLYLTGRTIQKTGPQSYAAEEISITSCEGPDPAWELTGKEFKVTVEGYGSAWHTALWAGKIPVIYSPYLFFPVKLKRQSGLLMPEIGYSDRKGTEYLQPYFWAINESSDATFYSHFMTERGVRNGIEYRYVLDADSRGALYMEGFQDGKIDDGQGDNSRRWGYENDATLRENKDRYWVRMKHDQTLGWGLTSKLDLDVVSDQDYLHEFKSGYNGFDQSRSYFRDTFGRDIDDYNDPIRLNRLNLNRTWNQYSLNGDLRWYDDVIKRRQADTDNTLQQLPDISLDGIRQPLGRTPFYFDLTSNYTYFYRINGTRGQRADIYPRIYYPFDLFQALSVEPSIGVRQTAWHVDAYETQPDHERDTLYRALYDFKLDVSTEFYRIFDFDFAGNELLKHALTPEIIYEFTPDDDQSDYPVFDAIDQIEKKNLITYGLTNTFTARASRPTADNGREYLYNPFLRFKLSQSFDINKHNENEDEPFSYIQAELDLNPGRYVGIDSDAQWSVYDSQLESLNTALRLWDERGDLLRASYRYTRENIETATEGIQTLRLDGEIRVSDQWRLRAGYEQNYFDDLEIDRSLGFTYQSHCWGMAVDYGVEEDNQRVTAVFNLVGLGTLGQ